MSQNTYLGDDYMKQKYGAEWLLVKNKQIAWLVSRIAFWEEYYPWRVSKFGQEVRIENHIIHLYKRWSQYES